MPWQIGIDEAGYGPNLGPLVQTSVAVQVPEGISCLWESLKAVIRKSKEKEDGRILIDDSKKVNEGIHGLAKLERGVLALFLPDTANTSVTWEFFLSHVGISHSLADLQEELWYAANLSLPAILPRKPLQDPAQKLHSLCESLQVRWEIPRVMVTPARRYNQLLDQWDLKSNVLIQGVLQLLKEARLLPGTETIHISIDKLGGRNNYGPMLQDAFPDGWVRTLRESAQDCSYSVLGIEREVHLTFQPKADGTFLPVALASMVSKYVREIGMRQFNDFWIAKSPGLKETAGYPVDALRFLSEIEGILAEMKLPREHLWRRK